MELLNKFKNADTMVENDNKIDQNPLNKRKSETINKQKETQTERILKQRLCLKCQKTIFYLTLSKVMNTG